MGAGPIQNLFSALHVPPRARRNYLVEIRHMLLWGVFAGLIEGGVSAVIVSKTFHGSDWLIALVQATPALANLTSLVWGVLLVGRPKLPILMALGVACTAVTLTVALTPVTGAGAWLFAAQIALSRVFMAGVVESRASLWKINYPRSHRGRVAANLQVVRTLGSIPLVLGAGALFDLNPLAYHWFYPLVAVIGAAGLVVARQQRIRDPRFPRRGRPTTTLPADGIIQPLPLLAVFQPWHVFARLRGALRENPRFARYCQAQMCIGSANLMVMPVHTVVLTKVLALSYSASNSLLEIIPRAMMLLSLPAWARLFDRVGVLRFRVVNSACWSGSVVVCGGAVLAAGLARGHDAFYVAALGAYALGRVIDGMAQSGGAIAWNIGHLHFAEDDKAELYMGVHVSLTGLRGLTMPFIGMGLYKFVGAGVFIASAALSLVGGWLFSKLAVEERSASRSESVVLEDRLGAGNDVAQPADLGRR
ncbi:MAG: hypothetical protein U1A27_09375 [Phycisphaerae bacterium]